MNAAKAIQAYRQKEKLSVRELAIIIGVEFTALWRFEKGKEIKSHNWVKIVKWLLAE